MRKLIIFDLDGTLAESKQPLTHEMATLLSKLLAHTRIAVISGGALSQFLKQVVAMLPVDTKLANLYLLPTSGAALYEFHNGELRKVYEERLTDKESQTIDAAIREAITETGVIDLSVPSYDERIEHRGSQVTLSALGQKAPVDLKMSWDPDRSKREALRRATAKRLPGFLVKIGGKTSVDVTKLGIDKAYGVHQLCERIGVPEPEALFIGDELEAGGNDEAVYKTEVATCVVKDPADTLRTIKTLLTAA
jgi:hypothetical protein